MGGKSKASKPRAWRPGDPIKSCGDCTMCCKLISVREFDKPAGVWCKHCDIGKGCKIYSTRPQGCRNYMCLWKTSNWPDDQRPDRSKVVWEMTEDGKVALAMLGRPRCLDTPYQREFIRWLLKIGTSVIALDPVTQKKAILVAPGKTEGDVMASIAATGLAQDERFVEAAQ